MKPNDYLTTESGITPHIADQFRRRRKTMAALVQQEGSKGVPRNDLSPKLDLVKRRIADLKPAKRRVRKSDPVQIAKIRHSLETYGFCIPVLITASGEIVSGHLVCEAATSLGLSEVYCVVIDHLTPLEIRKLYLSINRIAETGTTDYPELKIEMRELAEAIGNDFNLPGYVTSELDIILQDEELNVAVMTAGDSVPDVQPVAITRIGDIWQCGDHRIGCGNAKDENFVLHLVAAATVRLCLTDPPFGVFVRGHVTSQAHREFLEGGGDTTKEELYDLFFRSFEVIQTVLVDGGLCLSFIDWRGVEIMLRAGRESGFTLLNLIVWAKTNAGLGSFFRSGHELIPLFKKGHASHVNNISLGKTGRYRTNLWSYPGASSFGSDARKGLEVHPTVKGVAMLEDAIFDMTNRGDVVFDPFAGSGSTLVAAHQAGRVFRGCELDPLYVDVILRRWLELTDEQPILLESGEAFSAVTTRRLEVAP